MRKLAKHRLLGTQAARRRRTLASGLLLGALSGAAVAQTVSSVPDAQVEANVLKALANAPELSTQDIQSSTVYGVVTLSGTVQTEELRTKAENLAARASGVKKVLDELTLGTPSAPPTSAAAQPEDQQGNLAQADEGYDPSQPQQPASPYQGPSPQESQNSQQPNAAQGGQPGYPANPNQQQPAYGQPQYNSQPPYPQGAYNQPTVGQPGYNQGAPAYGQPQPGYSQPPAPYGQQPNYPQQGYAPGQPQPYPQGYAPQGGQAAGQPVTVPSGALLRVRINRGLDSNHVQPGMTFDGTVLSDIAGSGVIAIPRGATVQGVVVDARKAGALKGEGELALQINSVMLGGTSYPLISDTWEQQGRDKSVRTVNSAVGLGVLGAIIGGVAGGGAGAAVGAGVGAGVGVAGSASSPGGRIIVPPEAVLSFHLAQPAQVRTVSEQEMQRLAYTAGPPQGPGGPPVVRRRYYAPYYGPAPYPYYPYRY